MKNSRRNYEIDFLKLLFVFIVVIYHSKKLYAFDGVYPLMSKGYLCSDFFFMVSGYYLMNGIALRKSKSINQSIKEILFDRLKMYYPHILFAFFVSFIIRNFVCEAVGKRQILYFSLYSVSEILGLKSAGLAHDSLFYNTPSWFIYSLLISIFVLIYPAEKYGRKFSSYFAPLFSVFMYSLISNSVFVKGLNASTEWLGFINGGLARGLAGVSLGAFIFSLSNDIKLSDKELSRSGKRLVELFELFIIVLLILLMRNRRTEDYGKASDLICLFYFAVLLIIVFSKKIQSDRIFAFKPLRALYPFALPVFLNQRSVIYFLNAKFPFFSARKSFVLYVAMVGALAFSGLVLTNLLKLLSRHLFSYED